MNYTKELLEKNRVKFTVEVSADEWRAAIDEAYNKNKGKFQIEGFRKGKAPRKVIESVYGVGVFYEDAMDIILPKTYSEILDKESELFPVDSPEIDIDAISDSTFKYTATVQLKPDVKLGAFKGLKFTRTVKAVTDEEVEERIKSALDNAGSWEPIGDRAVADGDRTVIDYSGSVDGVKFDGGTAEKQNLTIGSHTFIPGFEEQVAGMKVGESKDITVTFPEDYHEKSLAGKEAVFAVTVHEATHKVVPELDDESVKDISDTCNTVEEYRAFVRAEIEKEHADSADQELENAMVDAIADASEVDIPECMVEEESKHKIEEFAYQLQYQGLNIDDYYKFTGSTEEDLMKRYHDSSLKSVKYRLVMQELIKQVGPIDVTDEQVLAFIKEQMGAMGDRYEKIADVPDEYVNYARSIETTKKVFALLREMNTVEDAVADASKAKKTAKKATKKADDAEGAPKAKKTAKKADKE